MGDAWCGGKGDRPRPQNKKSKKVFDSTLDEIFGDYCRFNHKHDSTCKLPKKGKNKKRK